MGRIIKQHILGNALAMGIVFCFLIFFYGELIFAPNNYLFASTDDGLKAYYVYAYHIKHDASYHQFSGMNYPYGQTYIYTDGQPAIANAVKAAASVIPAVEPYSIGIYNSLVILSFLFTAVLVFKLLMRCRLPGYYAGVFAGLITVLSPQFFRLSGHMTLTYTCFFPLLWYSVLRYLDGDKKRFYTALIVFTGIFWAFVHPYYLPAQVFFLAGVFAMYYLFLHKGWNIPLADVLLMFAQIIVPVIAVKLYDSMVDIHTGRPENPMGFFDYVANWKTIFFPAYHNSYPFFEPYIGKLPAIERWEGVAYIGLVADVAIVGALIYLPVKCYQFIRTKNYILNIPTPIKQAALPAIAMLFLAMAMPFALHPKLAVLSQKIPYIRQFRSLGRFAWPFYYVATVYGVWALYQAYAFVNSKIKYAGYALLIPAVAVFVAEGYYYHQTVVVWQNRGQNIFKPEVYAERYGKAAFYNWKQDFQAAVTIPFFRIGAENFSVQGTHKSADISFAFSYHNGIPLLASSAARTPDWEAQNSLQFFAPPFAEKALDKDIIPNKNFLVLYTGEVTHATPQYNLLARCSPLLADKGYSLLSYKPVNSKQAAADILHKIDGGKSVMLYYKGFYFDKPDTTGFYYFPLDTFKSAQVFEGAGAFESTSGDIRVIYPPMHLHLDTAKEYVVSFWHKNANAGKNDFLFAVEQGDSTANNKDWNDALNTRETYHAENGWYFCEFSVKPRFANGIISLLLYVSKFVNETTYTDEIMIRPAGVNVYKPTVHNGKKALICNNYRIYYPN